MEWVIGVYTVIGIWRAIGKVAESDPSEKPLWMMTEQNGLIWALYFAAYVLLWPFVAWKAAK